MSFCSMFVFAATAQKACTAKAKTAKTSCCMATAKATATAAASAAAKYDDIESRTCAKSGKVSYVRKVVNAETGAVNFEEVKYCTTSKKFINASPSKTSCKKGTATATSSKKACTKPCTKSKTAKMETSAKAADAKLVKNEMEN